MLVSKINTGFKDRKRLSEYVLTIPFLWYFIEP